MAKNTRFDDGTDSKETKSKILVDSNNATANNVDIAKNGDSDRNEIRTDKMDRICEIGKELSDKVLKKIDSKDYLKENLARKCRDDNVSRETLGEVKDEQRNVLFNGFVICTCLCAVVLYIFSRILGKKSQKTSQNPPFENTDILRSGDTGEQKAGENDSLADAILIRAGDK